MNDAPAALAPPARLRTALPDYAELRCVSNFSFLKGASWPEELVERARTLGYSAVAIADECTMAGIVRAHVAAKEQGIRLLIGSQFRIRGDFPLTLTLLACSLEGYGNLCQFITARRRAAEKGSYRIEIADVDAGALHDCVALVSPGRESTDGQLVAACTWLAARFVGNGWLGVEMYHVLDDEAWLGRLERAAAAAEVSLVALGDVLMHVRSRKTLQDVMTSTRLRKPLTECGFALRCNAEQHLRSRKILAKRFPARLLDETLVVADRCRFSLD